MLTESMPCCDLDSSDMQLIVLPESPIVTEDIVVEMCNADREIVKPLSSQLNGLQQGVKLGGDSDTKLGDKSVSNTIVTRHKEMERKMALAKQSKKACLRSSKMNGIFPNKKPKTVGIKINESTKVKTDVPKQLQLSTRSSGTQNAIQTKTLTKQVFVSENNSSSPQAMPVLTLPCVLLQDCLKRNIDSGQQSNVTLQSSLAKEPGTSKVRIILPQGVNLNAFLKKPLQGNNSSGQAKNVTQSKRAQPVKYRIIKTEHLDSTKI